LAEAQYYASIALPVLNFCMADSSEKVNLLDPVATALDYKSRIDAFIEKHGEGNDLAARAVANELGVLPRKIWLYLSILKLGAPLQEMVSSGELSVRYIPAFVRVVKDYGDGVCSELAALLREKLPGDGSKPRQDIIDEIIVEVSKHIETDSKEREILELRHSFNRVLNCILGMQPHIEKLLLANKNMLKKALLRPDFNPELLYIAKLLRLEIDLVTNRNKKKKIEVER